MLHVTNGHYLPLATGELIAASEISVGDSLILGNGTIARVVYVSSTLGKGLYNPQTLHGNIVVNGIVASTYTQAVQPRVASMLLAPLRMAFKAFGLSISAFDAGAPSLAAVMPKGRARIACTAKWN